MFYAVLLKSKRLIVVDGNFIQTPIVVGQPAVIFHSTEESKSPNFHAVRKYLLDKTKDATYDGYILKSFGK